ncbi:hypothetical protein HHI36_012823 [Cryptolaemus montrouzieri]|uniref:Uncharacterized protein n=1 Tax=Cryptolaemus montrouzieri TaxID=559131 RepID=A0ABD2NFJ4_9CUCU
MLRYRMLSCSCDKFCDCYNLKTYYSLPKRETEVDIPTSDVEEPLTDITNIIASTKGFYETFSTSEDEDDQPIFNLRKSGNTTQGTSHDLPVNKIYPLLINNGTYLLIRVESEGKVEYTYLGVPTSEVDQDEDGRCFINLLMILENYLNW